jgi:putative flippase GtrA
VGVSSDFVVFYLINSAGTSYQLANIAGYGFGAIVSFNLNRIFTFKAKDKAHYSLGNFLWQLRTIGYRRLGRDALDAR